MIAAFVVRKIIQKICIGIAVLLMPVSLYAVCGASPAGQLQWDGANLIYCAGAAWRTVTGTSKGGSCSNGTIQTSGTQLRFCKAGSWWHVSSEVAGEPGSTGTDAGNSCVAGNTGQFYYDSGRQFYVYCNGTDWYDFW